MENERIYLLPKGNYYKANLHCHTTLSDGDFSPEEIKKLYQKNGYSIVAFSDHEKLIPHPELEDENFIPLTAVEYMWNEPGIPWPGPRSYHFNFIAKDKTKDTFVEFKREYFIPTVAKLLKDAKKDGFLCQYNHPRWSMQQDTDFLNLWDLDLFEVFNNAGEIDLFCGDGEHEYTQFCRGGGRCIPVATDDTHTKQHLFGGATYIFAEEFNYDNVIDSLEKGNCYASTVPIFKDLYIEDGKIHIACSDVMAVNLLTDGRNHCVKSSKDRIDDINEVTFTLPKFKDFLRVRIIDSMGRKAITRAYYKEEL